MPRDAMLAIYPSQRVERFRVLLRMDRRLATQFFGREGSSALRLGTAWQVDAVSQFYDGYRARPDSVSLALPVLFKDCFGHSRTAFSCDEAAGARISHMGEGTRFAVL